MIDFLRFVLGYIFSIWWFLLVVLLWFIVKEKHLITVRFRYKGTLKYSYLEIKIPRYVKRSAKAMEEIFYSLHSIYRKSDPYNRYIKGFTPPTYSFEMVLHNGQLRFFIRCYQEYKDFVIGRIYSQYPEAVVEEVEDPLKILPAKIPNPTFDVWGTEFVFTKEAFYPIRTYEVWEKLPEEQRIDPISLLSEGASFLSDKEWIVIQLYAMPVLGFDEEFGDAWAVKGKKKIDELMKRVKPEEPGPLDYILEFIKNLFLALLFQPIEWKVGKEEKKPEEEMTIMKLTPGEREIIEGIERKISKPGYWTNVRFCYVATKDLFKQNLSKNTSLVMGIFKVFERQDMNSIIRDTKTVTSLDRPISFFVSLYDEKIFYRKRYVWAYLKGRWGSDFKENFLILNTEEMASLFHIPMEFVPAPGIERIPTRPISPPPEVPTI